MSIWAIGDVQGCNQCLQKLLNHAEIINDKQAKFWFCGDLVNRGPDSLGVLDTVMALQENAVTVLGNHDLHLLGMVAGIRKPGRLDTLNTILESPELDKYINWLRFRPVAHLEDNYLLVHAGVLPAWSAKQTMVLADLLHVRLRSDDWQNQIRSMYGNNPSVWNNNLNADEQFRFIINVLTRMRMLYEDGGLDFDYKGEPIASAGLKPWFRIDNRLADDHTIVFGHWSALGLLNESNLIGLDTGCVWGRELTAVRLQDRKVIQINCTTQQ